MENKIMYILVAFPYPSGDGLHMGHVYNYAITDSYCRSLQYRGIEVFQPFGYDAFGLPAENYAKKIGRKPDEVTWENIIRFRKQMNSMNTGFEELLITCTPEYIKWTQWLFLKLKEHNLAYKAKGVVNYCPSCETVLAREQVIKHHIMPLSNGKQNNTIEVCERCKTPIEEKELEQWYFKITAYKERLSKNLDWIDYPESTINAQRKWLENQHDWCVSRQRPWGCPIPIEGETDTLDTFVDSSFYFIRYCDAFNENELCSKENYKQVDLYIGGSEHACMHLIYARFIHMFLYDIGIVPTEEPFKRLIHQGMILNNGQKMSKSTGNVISPDNYDHDELRFYLMFLGHYFDGGSWKDNGIIGVQRFIRKMKTWIEQEDGNETLDFESFERDILNYSDSFKFNKVVSEFMILFNNNKNKKLDFETKNKILNLLEVYMPTIKDKIQIWSES